MPRFLPLFVRTCRDLSESPEIIRRREKVEDRTQQKKARHQAGCQTEHGATFRLAYFPYMYFSNT